MRVYCPYKCAYKRRELNAHASSCCHDNSEREEEEKEEDEEKEETPRAKEAGGLSKSSVFKGNPNLPKKPQIPSSRVSRSGNKRNALYSTGPVHSY